MDFTPPQKKKIYIYIYIYNVFVVAVTRGRYISLPEEADVLRRLPDRRRNLDDQSQGLDIRVAFEDAFEQHSEV